MRHALHILLLVVTVLLGASCQDVHMPTLSSAPVRQERLVQSGILSHVTEKSPCHYGEAHLSNAMSLCRLACNPEDRVESRTGETHSPTPWGGGKAFTACRAPRSTIHKALGGFAQRTTVPICSVASHTHYIYVLRHILR